MPSLEPKSQRRGWRRAAALLAAPFVLARYAIDLATRSDERQSTAPAVGPRIKIVPPEHSVMRRG